MLATVGVRRVNTLVAEVLLMVLAVHVIGSLAYAGLGSDKAKYMGGTISKLIPDETEGKMSTSDEKMLSFDWKKGKQKNEWKIPYDRINSLEYGQKAGRRVGMAIALSVFALFSKKRKHYLTIGYLDENDKQQGAVFELGKGIVRVTLASLEARSGRKTEYQDEEARKSSRGN